MQINWKEDRFYLAFPGWWPNTDLFLITWCPNSKRCSGCGSEVSLWRTSLQYRSKIWGTFSGQTLSGLLLLEILQIKDRQQVFKCWIKGIFPTYTQVTQISLDHPSGPLQWCRPFSGMRRPVKGHNGKTQASPLFCVFDWEGRTSYGDSEEWVMSNWYNSKGTVVPNAQKIKPNSVLTLLLDMGGPLKLFIFKRSLFWNEWT